MGVGGRLLSSQQRDDPLDCSGGTEVGKNDTTREMFKDKNQRSLRPKGQLAFSVKRNVNFPWQKTLAVHNPQLMVVNFPWHLFVRISR